MMMIIIDFWRQQERHMSLYVMISYFWFRHLGFFNFFPWRQKQPINETRKMISNDLKEWKLTFNEVYDSYQDYNDIK